MLQNKRNRCLCYVQCAVIALSHYWTCGCARQSLATAGQDVASPTIDIDIHMHTKRPTSKDFKARAFYSLLRGVSPRSCFCQIVTSQQQSQLIARRPVIQECCTVAYKKYQRHKDTPKIRRPSLGFVRFCSIRSTSCTPTTTSWPSYTGRAIASARSLTHIRGVICRRLICSTAVPARACDSRPLSGLAAYSSSSSSSPRYM